LTDGAFFNSGQSCCGIKRIYVAASRYQDFVDGAVDLTRKYRLGSPLDPETTLDRWCAPPPRMLSEPRCRRPWRKVPGS